MDLSTIGISPAEAKAKLDEYAGVIAADRSAEDAAILAGYRAAARGLAVIFLPRVIAAGGWHDNGLPKIAVARATAAECSVRWSGQDLVFTDGNGHRNQGALVGAHSVRVTVPGDGSPAGSRWASGTTLVPPVPPRYRPRPRNLRHRHILWEVPEWKRVPPADPALLRHIRGGLWAVLATWDLTQLERAVLSQR
jgi:hypothetical protein